MTPPPPLIHVRLDTSQLGPAFARWAELRRRRGRSDEGVPRKVMRFWISAAMSRIPRAEAEKIGKDLMKIASLKKKAGTGGGNAKSRRRRRRLSALAEKYRGTVAALLVQRLNWRNANTDKKKNGGSMFYSRVGQFIGARKWSRGVHRAGFFPVIRALKAERHGYLPRLKKVPGTYVEKFADDAATLIAENMASSAQRPGGPAPDGIAGVAPDCLKDSEADMARLFEKWLAEDEADYARRAGFFSKAA